MSAEAPLVEIAFSAEVIHWRGPAPFLFAAVPEAHVGEVRHAARIASYGWGCVPAEAEVEGVVFTTALFPRGETYLLPLKAAVRKAAGVELGDVVRVVMRISAPGLPQQPAKDVPGWMREF